MKTKTRKELIRGVRPNYWPFFRADNGDIPEGVIHQQQERETDAAAMSAAL
jgi:hypothetical protein